MSSCEHLPAGGEKAAVPNLLAVNFPHSALRTTRPFAIGVGGHRRTRPLGLPIYKVATAK